MTEISSNNLTHMLKIAEIKAGQVWETRSGQRIRIEEILTDHGTTPVRSGDHYWQTNGRYWSDLLEHSQDLVRQIE